jgi:anthranilate/para-aminobenzoate synthase component I
VRRLLTLPWHAPLHWWLAIVERESYFAFLYSGVETSYSGRYSYLAFRMKQECCTDNILEFTQHLYPKSSSSHRMLDGWFGYFSYEIGYQLQSLDCSEYVSNSVLDIPMMWWVQYRAVMVFDHHEQTIQLYFDGEERELDAISNWIYTTSKNPDIPIPLVTHLTSNMTKSTYLTKVGKILHAIEEGILYQANLTRKFYGTLTHPSPVMLFYRMAKNSPVPYSACIRHGELSILSASPEQFVKILPDGQAASSPIKGSMARDYFPAQDAINRSQLFHSSKDRAENLMIVDLVRNDLARNAVPGTVNVVDLFNVHSFANIHHLISTIHAQKREDVSALSMVEACFPPGSMTGAPKSKVMEFCAMFERMPRGVYSGALGWFGGDDSCDLSVVIRTLVLKGNKFEFQVGGGIVSDSIPEKEWRETIIKARSVANILNIKDILLEKM